MENRPHTAGAIQILEAVRLLGSLAAKPADLRRLVSDLVKGVNVPGRKAEPDWKIKVTGSRGDLQAKTKKNSQQIFKFSGFHFCSFRCAREGRCMFFVVKLSPPPTGFALATLGFRLLGGLSDEQLAAS